MVKISDERLAEIEDRAQDAAARAQLVEEMETWEVISVVTELRRLRSPQPAGVREGLNLKALEKAHSAMAAKPGSYAADIFTAAIRAYLSALEPQQEEAGHAKETAKSMRIDADMHSGQPGRDHPSMAGAREISASRIASIAGYAHPTPVQKEEAVAIRGEQRTICEACGNSSLAHDRAVWTDDGSSFCPACFPTPVQKVQESQTVSEANEALMRERANMITTHREQIERLTAERDEAVKEIEAAKKDLRSFMTTFVREHFPHVPQWEPLPDLLGMLSQMDNASTIAREYAAKLGVARQALDRISSPTQTDKLLWWQIEARATLQALSEPSP